MSLYVDVMDIETHRLLASAYAGLGRNDKAVDEWSVAVEIKPDDPELVVSAAHGEIAAGRKEAARKRLEALHEKTPDFAPAKKLLDELK